VPKLHDWYTAVAAAGEVESELATLAADERRVGKPRSGMGDIIDGEENRKFSDWSEPEWSWQESAIWRARFREFATQWAVGGQCACCASAGGEDPSVAFVMHVSVLIIYSEYVCVGVGQERLGPSYFFISLVLGPLNSLVWYVPSLRYTRGLGWRMHCGVEVTESSTNEQHHLSLVVVGVAVTVKVHATHCSTGCRAAWRGASTSRRAIRSGNGRRPCPSSSGRCGSTRLRRRRCCKIFRCPTSPRRRAGTHSLKRTLVVTFSTLYDDCLVLYLSMSTGLMTVAYSSTVGDSMMTVSFI